MLAEYEGKFDKIKVIIGEKDNEISQLKAQMHNLYE